MMHGWPLAWPWLALGLALAGPWPGPGWPLAWPLAGPWPGPWLALGLALGWPGSDRFRFRPVPVQTGSVQVIPVRFAAILKFVVFEKHTGHSGP